MSERSQNRLHGEPVRILQWGMTDNIGGMETFLMGVYRNIDRSRLQFDFLTAHDRNIAFADEIESLGGRIFRITYGQRENPLKARSCLDEFFRDHPEIRGIHMHSCFMTYALPLVYAKRHGVPIRIYHSHNSGDMYTSHNPLRGILEHMTRRTVGRSATELFACSDEAGRYMFHDLPFRSIHNGIDTERFAFDRTVRQQVRQELGLQDRFVIGMVGRLQYQKNPQWALQVFAQVRRMRDDAVLCLVGDGPDREEVRSLAEDLGVEDSVLFLGIRRDTQRLYQAFDTYLMTSRFEGLPVVLIEAQCAGLPCLVSDSVSREAAVTDLVRFVSLDRSAQEWAKTLIDHAAAEDARQSRKDVLQTKGYDSHIVAKQLEQYYLNRC